MHEFVIFNVIGLLRYFKDYFFLIIFDKSPLKIGIVVHNLLKQEHKAKNFKQYCNSNHFFGHSKSFQ